MTPDQIKTVQDSFAAIAPHAESVAESFFQHLFTHRPAFQLMFPEDLTAHGLKLIGAIGMVVESLASRESVAGELTELGRRHAVYGVRGENYEIAGESLIAALRETLGEGFSAEAELAWRETYFFVASAMIEGARELQRESGAIQDKHLERAAPASPSGCPGLPLRTG
jgi:hemoglobin-like flavoprotein